VAILLNNQGFDNAPWRTALNELLPEMPVYEYPDIANKEDIEYAVIWNHPHGDLLSYPNLKAILILGAGTDHIDGDANLPDVPIVRLLDPDVSIDMAHYVCYWTMHFHRQYERYRQQSKSQNWLRHEVSRISDYRVGVLGLGRIGSFIAEHMANNCFNVLAWNRSYKQVPGVACSIGESGLRELLGNVDVLVNCLPLNQHTERFLNAEKFAQLCQGAALINVSRGAIIDDHALQSCLASGKLSGAALDCFVEEPLPNESPYWQMPNVYVTPHTSGATYAKSAAAVVVENILRIERGEQPFPLHQPP